MTGHLQGFKIPQARSKFMPSLIFNVNLNNKLPKNTSLYDKKQLLKVITHYLSCIYADNNSVWTSQ